MTILEFSNMVAGQVPWYRSNWTGKFLSFDGTSTADFTEKDVARVLAAKCTNPHDWDGEAAAVIQLKDGRWVAWESGWGPTGSGFCCDAYGGDANVYFGATPDEVITFGLSPQSKELLGLKDLCDPKAFNFENSEITG